MKTIKLLSILVLMLMLSTALVSAGSMKKAGSKKMPSLYTCGDVAGDGVVDSIDAWATGLQATGVMILSPTQILLTDINRDGAITVIDVLQIQRRIAGLVGPLDCAYAHLPRK